MYNTNTLRWIYRFDGKETTHIVVNTTEQLARKPNQKKNKRGRSMSQKTQIALQLQGGLGNQMFQIAYLWRIMKRFPELEIGVLPHTLHPHETSQWSYLDFWPSIPRVSLRPTPSTAPHTVATTSEVPSMTYLVHKETSNTSHELTPLFALNHIPTTGVCLQVQGYFHRAAWYEAERETLCTLFLGWTLREVWRLRLLPQHYWPDVGLHVRRGDYEALPQVFRLLELSYYQKAFQLLNLPRGQRIWLFTDAPEWCAEHLLPWLQSDTRQDTVIPWSDYVCTGPLYECWYMSSLCPVLIGANSTLSWWSAFLSTTAPQHIVMPRRWFTTTNHRDQDSVYVRKDWLYV